MLVGAKGGRIDARGRTSALDTIGVALRADGVPLADIGELIQTREPMAGRLSMRADVRGTRSRPDLFFTSLARLRAVAGRYPMQAVLRGKAHPADREGADDVEDGEGIGHAAIVLEPGS